MILIFWLISCSSENPIQKKKQGEYLDFSRAEKTVIPAPTPQILPSYPWEKNKTSGLFEITKEYFRCKGNSLNPIKSDIVRGEVVKRHDCGGAQKHSLPLIHGKEGVYPILITLLNFIQTQTGKRVIITSGHRCPEHNTYVDSSPENQYSKHQIGAEVDFYVQGFESQPEAVLALITSYYETVHKDNKDYAFRLYEKDYPLTHNPILNKELFIKIHTAKEGRNDDNRHPYPYLTLQVRYDPLANARVNYSWQQAFHNYLRY